MTVLKLLILLILVILLTPAEALIQVEALTLAEAPIPVEALTPACPPARRVILSTNVRKEHTHLKYATERALVTICRERRLSLQLMTHRKESVSAVGR